MPVRRGLVLHHVTLCIACDPRGLRGERETKMEVIVFHNNVRVAYQPLLYFIGYTDHHGIMKEMTTHRYEYQRTEIIGEHFRGWLPQERRLGGRDTEFREFEMTLYTQEEIVSKHLDMYLKLKGAICTRNKN